MSVEVKLSRSDRVYHAGEPLQGEVVVTSRSGPVHHNGVSVLATGAAQMRVSERAVGVFEAFFLNIRPVVLLNETVEVVPPGRFEDGVTRLPFSLPLRPPPESPKMALHETYHGVNVNVQVRQTCVVRLTLRTELIHAAAFGPSMACQRRWTGRWSEEGSCRRCGLDMPYLELQIAYSYTLPPTQGLVEFIIEFVGSSREQNACDASKPVDFVLQLDEVCNVVCADIILLLVVDTCAATW